MVAKLNDSAVHEPSQRRLSELYANALISADKKPFVVDLEKSSGAYLSVLDDEVVLLDAASQIATLGLGFNHGALFGAAQHLCSWIDDTRSDEFRGLRAAYQDLLRRKLGSKTHSVTFCNSGAEAIEQALSICFRRRVHPDSNRVIAFEGAFHGRTKIALETTWNPEKRAPFSWVEQAAIFAPYPEMSGSQPAAVTATESWSALWSELDDRKFLRELAPFARASDDLLRREVESLQFVRKSLSEGRCFAILIEPMQCEGGDRYSSRRFHQGLATLAQSYGIPLIYDEIQTGFHLGQSFFWHRQFDLTSEGHLWVPDVVVTAKKAQVGVVMSRWPTEEPESAVAPASLARGYIQASVLDQFSDVIPNIEQSVAERLSGLARRHAPLINCPRGQGLAFAFNFASAELLKKAIAERFQFGLVFYPAGELAARFRLNLSFGEIDIDQLFAQLDKLLENLGGVQAPPIATSVDPANVAHHFEFHQRLIDEKLAVLRGRETLRADAVQQMLEKQIGEICIEGPRPSVHLLDRSKYQLFRDRILAIQAEVYEPARQTPGSDFDRVFASDRPLAIVVESEERIIGMAFAGPMHQFKSTHGVASDIHRDAADSAYMVDVTVVDSHRGRLGRILKQAIVLLAITRGYRTIHGRNRDKLARGMWAINLSLGSYVTQYLENDYDDDQANRDCLYYECHAIWNRPNTCLSNGIESPFGLNELTPEFVKRNLPLAVNKLTLSNFVDERFVEDLQTVAQLFPEELRHVYLASSLSEAVDKVVKSLWLSRAPRKRLVTFQGHFFGNSTLLTRSLSGVGQPMFDVQFVNVPESDRDAAAWDQLHRAISGDEALAFFVEPLSSHALKRMDPSVLVKVRTLCTEHGVPLVFNDSAGMFHRFSDEAFSPSGVSNMLPDIAVANLGGQMAMAFLTRSQFVAEPLKLISTWDGDGFSLAKFAAAARAATADRSALFYLRDQFQNALSSRLRVVENVSFQFDRGIGWIKGELSNELAALFDLLPGGMRRVCPSVSAMHEFLQSTAET